MLRNNGREVLVTAKYLRPGRNQPVNRVNILMRDARHAARRGRERRRHLHGGPRAAVPADLGQGLLLDPAAPLGPVHRRPEAPDARDHRGGRRPRHPADHRAARRLAHRRRTAADPAAADRRARGLRAATSSAPWPAARSADRFAVDVPEDAARGVGRPRPARPDPVQPHRERVPARRGRRHPGGPALERGARRCRSPRATPVDLSSPTRARASPPDHRDLVFSRFWHGSGRGTPVSGLYVVKGLVEAHGGQMQVETRPAAAPSSGSACPEPPDYLA